MIGSFAHGASSAQLRSMFRYQFSGPVIPDCLNALVGLHVAVRKPGGQHRGLREEVGELGPVGDDRRLRRVLALGRETDQDRGQEPLDPGLEVALGDPWRLELQLVEVRPEGAAGEGERWQRWPLPKGTLRPATAWTRPGSTRAMFQAT